MGYHFRVYLKPNCQHKLREAYVMLEAVAAILGGQRGHTFFRFFSDVSQGRTSVMPPTIAQSIVKMKMGSGFQFQGLGPGTR